MILTRLTLHHFRNYTGGTFQFSPGINVIYGENAAGKTSALEGAYYLTGARSFRPAKDRDLVKAGEAFGFVEGDVSHTANAFTIRADLSTEKRRRLTVNGVSLKTLSELSGRFRAVLFSPEDLGLVKEGAAARRRFLDLSFSQLRPRYVKTLSAYNRALLQKTRVLRDHETHPGLLASLPDWSRQLADLGAILIAYRALFIAPLAASAARIHGDIAGGREALSVRYQTDSSIPDPSVTVPELAGALFEHMERRRTAELSARSALIGPHRDDLLVDIDGRPAKTFGSQGQIRTAALSLKLAEWELLKNDTGEAPVLLLDDVLSELDASRRDFVLSKIEGGQVLITLCDEREVAGLSGKTFHVKHGEIGE